MYLVNLFFNKIVLIYYYFFRRRKRQEKFIFGHLVSVLGKNKEPIVPCRKIIKLIHYQLPDENELHVEAIQSIKIDNAGGKSGISEMFSIEYFIRKYKAKDFIFEKQVKYWIDFKMVDYICTIGDERIGVSVTRAMGFPDEKSFDAEQAATLLEKKINGLIVASNSVLKMQSFYKCILHIWCQNHEIATLIAEYYGRMESLKCSKELSLLLTVCPDDRIYKNYSNQIF